MSQSSSGQTSLKFILDGQVRQLSAVSATQTVLTYLREQLHRTGTKEGCAEGDCGACTVVLGELHEGRVRLRAVNACIQFLPTLHGKALFTVESLKKAAASGALHPAQQAMVDEHGSQCGFCTPGFVMSLFALYKGETQPSKQQIHDHLSGNLCRCTGYKPIVRAAHTMYQMGAERTEQEWFTLPGIGDVISQQEQALIEQLQSITANESLTLESQSPVTGQLQTYIAPASIDELAAQRLAHPQATLLAGGTDVGLWVTKQHRLLDTVIYLGNVPELKTMTETDQALTIGAGVSLSDAFARMNTAYPELGELWRRFSSVQVRNAGTLGGNIANGSPIGDSMPVLITLGTRITLRKGAASREIDLQDFYLDYQKKDMAEGEFVSHIHIPKPAAGQLTRSYKLSKRFDQDISAVCAAFSVVLDEGKVQGIRIAYGGMAATPKRAARTELALLNQDWDETTVRRAMQALRLDFKPLSDMRATSDYRLQGAENLLYRFFLETRSDAPVAASSLNVFEFAEGFAS
ncbi:xanthine dehydrogenase small subunit [Leucothrix mucor]|uniref:xanthine dehydrogenase small subunit n=1 Tax=Leucothrix mucor TaxID=45248 RepID=UPI0003B693FE|nr:xanthine dehydrogenase small subunit [Leucothrix mucor]